MDPRVNFDRWSKACIELGVVPKEREYRRVRRAWTGLGRHYHTLTHLDSCLAEFDAVRDEAVRPAEVELALWYHDAVYKTWRRDNEERSADWALQLLASTHADIAERVRQMILATRHDEEGFAGDTALVIDIDLSILGAPAEVYERFERAIRREYWWVPAGRYVEERSKVLARFLDRPAIYQHDVFYRRLEEQARVNIEAALDKLGVVF